MSLRRNGRPEPSTFKSYIYPSLLTGNHRKNYRKFESALRARLKKAYDQCKEIKGPGSFAAMIKTIIQDMEKTQAIKACIVEFNFGLELLTQSLGTECQQIVNDFVTKLTRDYSIILDKKEKIPPAKLKAAQSSLIRMLDQARVQLEAALEFKKEQSSGSEARNRPSEESSLYESAGEVKGESRMEEEWGLELKKEQSDVSGNRRGEESRSRRVSLREWGSGLY